MKEYVFVSTEPRKVEEVATKVAQVAGVKATHLCWDRPDIIVFLEAHDSKASENLVLDKIAKVLGVQATEAHLVAGS